MPLGKLFSLLHSWWPPDPLMQCAEAAGVKPFVADASDFPVEVMLAKAAQRAAPRLRATTKGVRYRVTGTFVSEILALVAAVEAMHATHVIESGTASGFSTELLARYFWDSPVNITTIDLDDAHSLYNLSTTTRQRLAAYTNVDLRLADSKLEIPRILDALPQQARAVVFVDGPKGAAGRDLALSTLQHPRVVMVSLHDTAPFWCPHRLQTRGYQRAQQSCSLAPNISHSPRTSPFVLCAGVNASQRACVRTPSMCS
jgi:predicted O-methyltransferase YrrM